MTLDPTLEERIAAGTDRDREGIVIHLPPAEVDALCRSIETALEKLSSAGHPSIVLCSPHVRPAMRPLTGVHLPQLIVLSYDEITRDTHVESVAMVSENEEQLTAAA